MRIAIISDIHANREALLQTLTLCDQYGADSIICLGDVVGYGPDPGDCVDLVRSRCEACVLGNHDEAVVTGKGAEFLPKDGQRVATLHRKMLSDEQKAWLKERPLRYEAYNATFVHAGPKDPASWPRLDSFRTVQEQFRFFETPLCFVGHSHSPAIASSTLGVLSVRKGHNFLVDVGSVGQPRDNDPRLAFGLWDTETFDYTLLRSHYKVEHTVRRLREEGMSENLVERLVSGT